MTRTPGGPKLTLAQESALQLLAAAGGSLHLARRGFGDLAGPYVRVATAKALALKGLARLEHFGTALLLTPAGAARAKAIPPR